MSSTFQLCREPEVGKSGWFSVCRVIPTENELRRPVGSPNSDRSLALLKASYSVRASEYPKNTRVCREPGNGIPKRVWNPALCRRPVANW